jgi:pilus assembly protein CpaF
MEGDIITMQDIYTYDFRMGFDSSGRSQGVLKPAGLRPRVLEKLADHGVTVHPEIFMAGAR